MDTTTERKKMNEILSQSGLPTELVAKMKAAKAATSEPCPICRVGRGRFCLDIEGFVTINGTHPQRQVWAEADDLTRAAFLR